MEKNKTLDLIHIKVHALRMMNNYKASIFEQELNKLIADAYKDECAECKEKFERLKYTEPKKQSFLGGLFNNG